MAYTFHLDPAGLLDDNGDEWPMLVRLAATRYVIREEEVAAARAKSEAKR